MGNIVMQSGWYQLNRYAVFNVVWRQTKFTQKVLGGSAILQPVLICKGIIYQAEIAIVDFNPKRCHGFNVKRGHAFVA
jgi:hypothetical protein